MQFAADKTPKAVGETYEITIKATDGDGLSFTQTFTLTQTATADEVYIDTGTEDNPAPFYSGAVGLLDENANASTHADAVDIDHDGDANTAAIKGIAIGTLGRDGLETDTESALGR